MTRLRGTASVRGRCTCSRSCVQVMLRRMCAAVAVRTDLAVGLVRILRGGQSAT
jgi:hypothetical protein